MSDNGTWSATEHASKLVSAAIELLSEADATLGAEGVGPLHRNRLTRPVELLTIEPPGEREAR